MLDNAKIMQPKMQNHSGVDSVRRSDVNSLMYNQSKVATK